MNNVDPLAWLSQTLKRLANGWLSSEIDALMPCWGGRLPTASECARMSSLKAQSRETVRGKDYQNWH
ncbi:transposase domain-containing protein [Mesorhizobium sp.]|uniref:transposase domain-containing protein n=1 Tax=Mesorhizobium sp. TaxID=1871066 RepID=UPI002620030D|nr:transposase domain-containing protein [Mesorhizobium sp.]